jgi:hypothetical protein
MNTVQAESIQKEVTQIQSYNRALLKSHETQRDVTIMQQSITKVTSKLNSFSEHLTEITASITTQ